MPLFACSREECEVVVIVFLVWDQRAWHWFSKRDRDGTWDPSGQEVYSDIMGTELCIEFLNFILASLIGQLLKASIFLKAER